jgi:type I restriction enzyme S subunit
VIVPTPAGWKRAKLGEIITLKRDPVKVSADDIYPNLGLYSFGKGAFSKPPINGDTTSAATLYRVNAGQVIYSRLFAFEGAFALVPEDMNGWFVSNEYPTFDVHPDVTVAEFVLLSISRPRVWRDMASRTVGLGHRRQRLQPTDFLDYEIDFPSVREQQQIVDAVSTVDAAVAAAHAERVVLASLLRAAQVETWQSAVADTVRLADVADVRTGSTPSRKNPAFFGGDVPWVKTGDIRYRDLKETSETLTHEGLASCSARLLPVGTVVLAMIGQGATRGRAAVLTKPMATNQNAAAIIPNDVLDSRYLFHWLWMSYHELRGGAAGTSQPALSAGIVSNLRLPLPPLDVQQELAERLDTIYRVLNAAADALEPLETMRASLVDSLISGGSIVRDSELAEVS